MNACIVYVEDVIEMFIFCHDNSMLNVYSAYPVGGACALSYSEFPPPLCALFDSLTEA